MQAGNVGAFAKPPPGQEGLWEWGIPGSSNELAMEVLSDYRLPLSIHDLFVNDRHRRFYQRLHRTVRKDEMGGHRNCDNMEIYAGSPSYLITAGGSPSDYAIDPRVAGIVFRDEDQQLGVAVTTSFMPTSLGGVAENDARALIQFCEVAADNEFQVNYGVAPDFACGRHVYLPPWASPCDARGFTFFNRSWIGDEQKVRPGFYLAVYRYGSLVLLEAFDTWLHPGRDFGEFCDEVETVNGSLPLRENQQFTYTTQAGHRIEAVNWRVPLRAGRGSLGDKGQKARYGAEVLRVEYGKLGREDPRSWDAIGDAGNVRDRFLSGTVLNSPAEAVVEITNVALGTKLTLDMSDPWHPRRTLESGVMEEAGNSHEVWVDFEWGGANAGDVCQPFRALADASDAVADGGVVKVMPGTTLERPTLGATKRFTLVAPIGGVVIGARDLRNRSPTSGGGGGGENVVKDDVWVEFDFPDSNKTNAPGRLPLDNLAEAVGAVADGGVIRIVPGKTGERAPIGRGKHCTLRASIGGVVIGAR